MRWKISYILVLFLFVCEKLCFKIASEDDKPLDIVHSDKITKFQQHGVDTNGERSSQEEILTPEEARFEGVILEDLEDGVKIVEDLSLFDEINSKRPVDADDIIGKFEPINVPTDFDSYDVDPKDGFIELNEIIQGTGAEENAKDAFKDADFNGDGLLSWKEFHDGPFNLAAEDENEDSETVSFETTEDKSESEFEFD